jgi:hypothetical protein
MRTSWPALACPAEACTFCKRLGLDTPSAYTVLRRWKGVELGQLQSYCDKLHHFDADQAIFYSSDSEVPLREVCPNCFTEVAANGACMCE